MKVFRNILILLKRQKNIDKVILINDKELKKQNSVNIYSTKELFEI